MTFNWLRKPYLAVICLLCMYSLLLVGVYLVGHRSVTTATITEIESGLDSLLAHTAESIERAVTTQDDDRIGDEMRYLTVDSDIISIAFIDNDNKVRFANHSLWLNSAAEDAFDQYSATYALGTLSANKPHFETDFARQQMLIYFPITSVEQQTYAPVRLIFAEYDIYPKLSAAISRFNQYFVIAVVVFSLLMATIWWLSCHFLTKPLQRLLGRLIDAKDNDTVKWPLSQYVALDEQVKALHTHGAKLLSRIKENEQRWLFAVDGNNNGLWDWDIANGEVFLSDRWKEILGYTSDELLPEFATWRNLLHPEDMPAALEVLQDYLDGKSDEYESLHRLHHKNGEYVWVKSRGMVVSWNACGRPLRMVGFHADVSDDIENQHTLAFLASHDPLTQLVNREHLLSCLSKLSAEHRQESYFSALFVIDLDNFKVINDALGHKSGDSLLVQVSKRLQDVTEPNLLARLGADEFALVVENIALSEASASEAAFAVAGDIRQTISQGLVINGHKLNVSASIGVHLLRPRESTSAGELLRCADMAMFNAKERGRDNCVIYSSEMERQVNTQLIIQNDLRDAIEKRQLELYYQPIVDEHGVLSGAEALLRWRHPLFGFISPAEFIPVAERSGLIDSLTRWVVKEACEFIVLNADKQLPKISLNISAHQFNDARFVERLLSEIKGRQLVAQAFELELTEHLFLTDLSLVRTRFNELQQAGFTVAIDDFGTGYSSLSYLQHLPLSRLKIDASFVRNIGKSEKGNAIVSAIIEMAHALKLDVVAEGVETPEQHAYLKSQQCDWFQGYLWSKPLPGTEFARLLPRAGDVRQLHASSAEPVLN